MASLDDILNTTSVNDTTDDIDVNTTLQLAPVPHEQPKQAQQEQPKQTAKSNVKRSLVIQPVYVKFAIITLVCVGVVCVVAYFLIRHQQNKLANKDIELTSIRQARDKAKQTIEEQQRTIDEQSIALERQKKSLTTQQQKIKEYEVLLSRQGPSLDTSNYTLDVKLNDGNEGNHTGKQESKQKQLQRLINTKRTTNEDMMVNDGTKQEELDERTQQEIKQLVHNTRYTDDEDDNSDVDDAIPIAINDDIITSQ